MNTTPAPSPDVALRLLSDMRMDAAQSIADELRSITPALLASLADGTQSIESVPPLDGLRCGLLPDA